MIFYLISIIFIWTEIYYVFNKKKLDDKFKNKDIRETSILDLIYYFNRFFYYVWLIAGLFSSQQDLFIFLIGLRFLSLPFYHISKRLYAIWDNILPSISVIFIIIIIVYGLFS